MKKKPIAAVATGLVGLMASGLTVSLLAWPADAGSGSDGDLAVKREEDTPDVVLVVEDDDDDPADALRARQVADTHTGTKAQTRTDTRVTRTDNSRDHTRTGARSGRDDSRSGRAVRDWTQDGPGPKVRDWSRNHTNDRSRHNTRG